jgi:hypothetical protein
LRDSPVRRLISRIDCFSRSAIRRMMFKSPMWITPLPPSQTALGKRSHGSVLNGNYALTRLSSAWKSTNRCLGRLSSRPGKQVPRAARRCLGGLYLDGREHSHAQRRRKPHRRCWRKRGRQSRGQRRVDGQGEEDHDAGAPTPGLSDRW